jgi:hypothetical protein
MTRAGPPRRGLRGERRGLIGPVKVMTMGDVRGRQSPRRPHEARPPPGAQTLAAQTLLPQSPPTLHAEPSRAAGASPLPQSTPVSLLLWRRPCTSGKRCRQDPLLHSAVLHWTQLSASAGDTPLFWREHAVLGATGV